MSDSDRLTLRTGSQISNARSLWNMFDSEEHKSGVSITLAQSTIGVNLDAQGDWTISIGLSHNLDRFLAISSGLEGLGFFQATENDGMTYFLWTSLLTGTSNVRTATEQILDMALKIVQAKPISQYIR